MIAAIPEMHHAHTSKGGEAQRTNLDKEPQEKEHKKRELREIAAEKVPQERAPRERAQK